MRAGRKKITSDFFKQNYVRRKYGHDSFNNNFKAGVKKTNAPVPEKQKINFLAL